ncbi:MAG TPA: 3-deoxy-D-manno-octulosonic acid transferase [Deltaproteobacteria bacterium]|nr:3-deoxy-D-manno-octulosonic acid transferase [Deltaproteobacteria bacterium]
MIFYLYNILVNLSFIILLPYFLFKIIFAGKYRKGLFEKFGFIDSDKLRKTGKKRVWLHAVSVGETKAVIQLVRLLKKKHPDADIVFSTMTLTGNIIANENLLSYVTSVIYFPLDLLWVVKRVVQRVSPDIFIVAEKEIWPNILNVLKAKGVPVVVVNGKISDRSFRRYLFFSFFFKCVFQNVAFFCAQTERDRHRAVALGVPAERVCVTGNLKFDMEIPVWTSPEREEIMQALGIRDSDIVFVAGSTHDGEEEIILHVFSRLKRELPGLKLLIAPRHPDRFEEIENLIKSKGFSFLKKSDTHHSSLITHHSFDVILLDTMGELGKMFGLATAAFVGGSLVNIGGHNLLEPVLHKKPVIFGQFIQDYREIADILIKSEGGIMVRDSSELEGVLRKIFLDRRLAKERGEAGYRVIEENRGVTKKCLAIIEKFLNKNSMLA